MKRETLDPRRLPGAVSIHSAVKALDFFVFDKLVAGLAYSRCPLGDHVLRVRGLSPEVVDLFCESGCAPVDLARWVNDSAPEPAA